ncbi:MAG TPA: peptide ligase PGM1-related protein [Candidatus Xenobia bacterium]
MITEDSPLSTLRDLPLPAPGSDAEEQAFQLLQSRLPALWRSTWHDRNAEQTVVVVPSLSFSPDELTKIKGFSHYEERLLFLLILLAKPRTRMVFVSSQPINPSIIDYYLQLLPGIPFTHARQRLHLFSTYDVSTRPLTEKVLERPHLIRRIRRCIGNDPHAHLTVFNGTPMERRLAVALGIPLLGTDPRHQRYGTKSGCRRLFEEVGVPHPLGFNDLKDENEMADAIVELAQRDPHLRKVVIKLNDGFSGEGNALYNLDALRVGKLSDAQARRIVLDTLPTKARVQAPDMSWAQYCDKFRQLEGVVECFIEGQNKKSPSVQLRLTPLGEVELISSHDQVLGGADGQTYLGCRFPARPAYRMPIHKAARTIGQAMASQGVIGRLSVDFLAVPHKDEGYGIHAIEINLRMGGTTHPYCTLQYLTNGHYNEDNGHFETPYGQRKYYVASDNIESPRYRGLLPEDLIDITTYAGMHYNSTTHTGVVFHMIGTLSEWGKLGVTCVGNSPTEAQKLYQRTIATLDREAVTSRWMT